MDVFFVWWLVCVGVLQFDQGYVGLFEVGVQVVFQFVQVLWLVYCVIVGVVQQGEVGVVWQYVDWFDVQVEYVVVDLVECVVVLQQYYQWIVQFFVGGGQFLCGVEEVVIVDQYQVWVLWGVEFGVDVGWQVVVEGVVVGGMQLVVWCLVGECVVVGIGQLGYVGVDESIGWQCGGDLVEDCLVQCLQWCVCCVDFCVQVCYFCGGWCGVVGFLWQVCQQCFKGLLGIVFECYGRGIEVVEFVWVDIDVDQFVGQWQVFVLEVGVGYFGVYCQYQVGFGDYFLVWCYVQVGFGVEWCVWWQQVFVGDVGEQWCGQVFVQCGKCIVGCQCVVVGDEYWLLGCSQVFCCCL